MLVKAYTGQTEQPGEDRTRPTGGTLAAAASRDQRLGLTIGPSPVVSGFTVHDAQQFSDGNDTGQTSGPNPARTLLKFHAGAIRTYSPPDLASGKKNGSAKSDRVPCLRNNEMII
jgi:hypothetical protein